MAPTAIQAQNLLAFAEEKKPFDSLGYCEYHDWKGDDAPPAPDKVSSEIRSCAMLLLQMRQSPLASMPGQHKATRSAGADTWQLHRPKMPQTHTTIP